LHQLETGVHGAVRELAAGRRAGPVANSGGRGAQAQHAGPAERLSGGPGGRHAGHVHKVPVRPAPVRAAAVRVSEQAGAAAPGQLPVLPVAVRPADRPAVPGQRHRTVAAARRRRDVRRVRRVRGRHPGHGVQRALGPDRQAVPAVRRQLRLHRQARVAGRGLGLPAPARGGRCRRRPVPEGSRLQHVHAAGQVLHGAGPRHRAQAVRHVRARLQAVRLQPAKHLRLRSGLRRPYYADADAALTRARHRRVL